MVTRERCKGSTCSKVLRPSFKTVPTHNSKKHTLIFPFHIHILSKGFYFQTGLCDMAVIYSQTVQLLKLSVWHLILHLMEYICSLFISIQMKSST